MNYRAVTGNLGFEHESHLLLEAAIVDRFRWTHPRSSRRGARTGSSWASPRGAASASSSFCSQASGAKSAAAAHNHSWRLEVQRGGKRRPEQEEARLQRLEWAATVADAAAWVAAGEAEV